MWPALEKAIEAIRARGWIRIADLNLISSRATIDGMLAWKLTQDQIEKAIQSLITRSLTEGWSTLDWDREIKARITGLLDYQAEAIGRTYFKQAYVEGQREVLDQNPEVSQVFSHYLYLATIDTRTDPEHAAMDGRIARRGSPLALEMERLIRRYNCRCSLILITEEDARSRGWAGD